MSDSTKTQALAKLGAFGRKIGYPDKWRDYSKLEVKRGEYYLNQRRAAAWSRDDQLGQARQAGRQDGVAR